MQSKSEHGQNATQGKSEHGQNAEQGNIQVRVCPCGTICLLGNLNQLALAVVAHVLNELGGPLDKVALARLELAVD